MMTAEQPETTMPKVESFSTEQSRVTSHYSLLLLLLHIKIDMDNGRWELTLRQRQKGLDTRQNKIRVNGEDVRGASDAEVEL